MRGAPRHFVASKVLCWVALDRAISLADELDAGPEQLANWRREAQAIRETVEREGWSDRLRSFTQSFGLDALDASNLMLAIYEFLPPHDPRLVGTVEAVNKHLTRNGFVDRYRRRRPRRAGRWVSHLHLLAGQCAGPYRRSGTGVRSVRARSRLRQ
jgi:GH15 family glucan-1,4-alpha-glucosidase